MTVRKRRTRKLNLSIFGKKHTPERARKRSRRHRAMSFVALTLVVALLLTGAANVTNSGLFKEAETAYAADKDATADLPGVKFSQVTAASKPNGMLLIGAYLIYDQYLSEQIYNLAIDSMTTYNQPIIYYKSTMAGGKWIDLSSASGFEDLRGKTGELVEESELANYKVCAIVYSDGVMSALTAGASNRADVNLFNLTDPYDIINLPELVPLKLLFEGVASDVEIKWGGSIDETLKDTTGARTEQIYEKIWTGRLLDEPLKGDLAGGAASGLLGKPKTTITDQMDAALKNLINAYSYYRRQGNQQYMQTILDAMGQADNARRAEVYYMLAIDGAGPVYDFIKNKQYDKLQTVEELANRFMVNNWGPNWYIDENWKKAIMACVKDHDRGSKWNRYDYNAVFNDVIEKYFAQGNIVDVVADNKSGHIAKGELKALLGAGGPMIATKYKDNVFLMTAVFI